jgi:hypothetical protein
MFWFLPHVRTNSYLDLAPLGTKESYNYRNFGRLILARPRVCIGCLEISWTGQVTCGDKLEVAGGVDGIMGDVGGEIIGDFVGEFKGVVDKGERI